MFECKNSRLIVFELSWVWMVPDCVMASAALLSACIFLAQTRWLHVGSLVSWRRFRQYFGVSHVYNTRILPTPTIPNLSDNGSPPQLLHGPPSLQPLTRPNLNKQKIPPTITTPKLIQHLQPLQTNPKITPHHFHAHHVMHVKRYTVWYIVMVADVFW